MSSQLAINTTPPSAEQQRIVAAIEQQFSRLDAGIAALRRAQQLLKRYRAAVLKAAVEGKLTEDWRAAHPDVEPGSALLHRILAERRTHWEEEQRAKGKDTTKMRYEEPATPDTIEFAGVAGGVVLGNSGAAFNFHNQWITWLGRILQRFNGASLYSCSRHKN